jgi:hypothetical protein
MVSTSMPGCMQEWNATKIVMSIMIASFIKYRFWKTFNDLRSLLPIPLGRFFLAVR